MRCPGFMITVCLGMAFAVPRTVTAQEHTFRTYQQNGVLISETGGSARYAEPLFSYEAILELEQDPDNVESLLYRPGSFVLGPDGCYYLVDYGNHRIAVFNEEGRYERSFGGEGEGPGTFRSPSFQGIQGDTLLIRDFRLNRTTRMKTDGSLIDVLIRPRLASNAARYQLSDDRQMLLHQVLIAGEKYMVQKAALTIVNAVFDTLTHVETDSVVVGIYGYHPGSESGQTYWLPKFPGAACYAYSGTRGAFLANGQVPVIYHINNDGELVERIVLDIPPTPVTREERRAIIADANRKVQERTGFQGQMAEAMRDNLHIPDVKGWWNQMKIDDAGYIWLAVVGDDGIQVEEGTGSLCDVISPTGRYLGRTRLPDRLDRCVVINGCVCAALRDRDTGEDHPTVFRIQSAVPGFVYPN
ncbi:6-bladed beta-propeller [Gemmatimonadota bacterium]